MAENQDGQEKTEEPSGKRLSDARQRGQLPRSRELNNFLLMLAASMTIYFAGTYFMEKFVTLFKGGLTIERASIFDPKLMTTLLSVQIYDGLWAIVPLLGLLVIVAVLSSIAVSGWNFSSEALGFKWNRVFSLNGLKRIFGMHGVIELIKSIIKFIILFLVAGMVLWRQKEEVVGLGRMPTEVAIAAAGEMAAWLFLILSASILVLALVDIPFQLWNHRRELRMTRQELKDENKDSEGSPETRSRIRRAQIEAVKRRMMQAVPKADVVITNPTHYAVALSYDQTSHRAPKVLAKGKGYVAQAIRELAEEYQVPVLRAAPLARALYHSTDINQEIPAGLYHAVAKVLAYIFDLRRRSSTFRRTHPDMSNIEIPREYLHDEE